MSNPLVIIYRNYLLAPSETFIRSQAEEMKCFTPYYVGQRFIPGLPLPESRTLVVNRGGIPDRINEITSKIGRFPPFLVKHLSQLQPKLIHAHFGQDGVVSMPLAKALKIPLVVTFHGYDITVQDNNSGSSLSQRMYLFRRDILKQRAQLFIAVSEFIRNKLIDRGFPDQKILLHYIGVDVERFQPDPSMPREQIVLFVGRLVEKKGCEFLIRAMARIQAIMPDVKLVIIGDGPLRLSLEQLAQEHLTSYCFLGVQSPDIIRDWMQRAKVFCVPSITASSGDSEGFGLVFSEAQASGLSVVSFASGGIPEAVLHEETGFLAAEKDVEGLTEYLLRFLQDQDLWNRFSHRGIERVRKYFNLCYQTRTLESLYQDIILHSKS